MEGDERLKMKGLVEYLVKSFVERPDKVLLAERTHDGSVYLELSVAPEDVGRVIGKNGKTINAMRTVAQAAAASRNKKCRLELIG